MEERRSTRDLGRRALEVESNSVLVATIALIAFIGIMHPDFLAWGQLKEVVQNSVYVGMIAAGMAFLISMREIDLSVGSMFGLALVVSALLIQGGMSPWVAGFIGVGLGCAMGLFNAVLVQFIAIPAIVATLATLSMYRGLSQALSDGQQVTGLPADNSFFTFLGGDKLGLPVSVWILILTAIVLTLVLRFTPYGYRVRAIGSNPEAATFSGISIARVRVQTLVLIGGLCGLSGMLGLAFFISGDPNIGTGFELQAIAAAVIGGTPLRGGSATVVGAILGAILLTPELFIRPLQQAGSQNVPLVAVDVPPPKGAEKDVKLLIGNSNEEIGQDLAKALLPKIPEGAKGEVMVGTDTPGLPVLEQRNKGFMDTLKQERPGLKYIVFDAKQSPTDNFNTWSAQVKAHPDALAYVGPGSQAAVSLSRIQRRGGKKLVVGACDLDPVALEGVRDGYVTALISPEHWLKGYLAIKLMAAAKQDGKDLPEGVWNSGALTVNSKNIGDIIKRQKDATTRSDFFKPVADEQLSKPDQQLGAGG